MSDDNEVRRQWFENDKRAIRFLSSDICASQKNFCEWVMARFTKYTGGKSLLETFSCWYEEENFKKECADATETKHKLISEVSDRLRKRKRFFD